MFRVNMCQSSGETPVFTRHLVLVILCGWLTAMHPAEFIPDSHPHRITVVSPDDGHIVARNMYRLINILRKNCEPCWLYLQDYTGMHGQQNIKSPKLCILQHWLHRIKYSCVIINDSSLPSTLYCSNSTYLFPGFIQFVWETLHYVQNYWTDRILQRYKAKRPENWC